MTSYNPDDDCFYDCDSYIQMDSYKVQKGSAYGDETVTVVMDCSRYKLPYTHAHGLSPTLHCYPLSTGWYHENVETYNATLIIDSKNRILFANGIEYEYEDMRIVKVINNNKVEYSYENNEDSWELYCYTNGEKSFIHSVTLCGDKVIKKVNKIQKSYIQT